MSGGGGGRIIIDATRIVLNNPIIHGSLSANQQTSIDPVLAKEDADWSAADKKVVAHVYTWALCNLM